MVRRHGPVSPTWATFLRNHLAEVVSIDFFVVPTVRHQILYVFLVLAPLWIPVAIFLHVRTRRAARGRLGPAVTSQ
jgi:hypothetical protein